MKKYKKILLIGSLIVSIIIILILGMLVCKLYNEKIEETNNISDLQTKINNLEEENKKNENNPIIQFLTSGKVISTSNMIGAGDPDMYYFTKDGKFAFINLPYFTEEGQTISAIGTWKIKDNKIVLTIQHEKIVKGGKMTEAVASDPFDHLINYTEELSNSMRTVKYEIDGYIKDEDKTYNRYYLKLDKMEWFQLNFTDDTVENLKKYAINGNY